MLGLAVVLFTILVSVTLVIALPQPAYATITLTPISTSFNQIVGIDHHVGSNKVIVSVNYPSGSPYNFELVAPDGTRAQFSNVSGLTEEVKIATVRGGPCQGGFAAGETFTGTGVAGVIARISPDGSTVQNPWVTLPDEPGLMRGSLFQDRYCAFGGDLIAVTTAGNVWRVTSAGVPTQLVSVSTHLEGVTTVPNDVIKYGPWAGKILAGAEEQTRIYVIAGIGNSTFYDLGINPEDIDIIPANENFYGVNYPVALQGAPASQFASMVGDILFTQESPGNLYRVHWNGTNFVPTLEASVSQWEHVTFSPAGIKEIPPVVQPVVGGEILGVDMTSLFIAGAFANAGWIVPIAGVTAAGIVGFVLRRRIK